MKTFVNRNKRNEHLATEKRQKNPTRARSSVLSNEETEALLAIYSDPTHTTAEIARRFGICAATVTNIVKQAGLPLRLRGRWRGDEPSQTTQQILLEAWTASYEVAAKRCGVTKQRVSIAVKRWRLWAVRQFGPRRVKRAKQAVQPKQDKAESRRDPSRHVVSFRVTEGVHSILRSLSKDDPSSATPNEVARRLLLQTLKKRESAKNA